MHVSRERKQVISLELGIAEARVLASQIRNVLKVSHNPPSILEELRDRLVYHVEKAMGDDAES